MDNLLRELREKGFILLTEDNVSTVKELLDVYSQLPEDLKSQTVLTEIPDEKVLEYLNGRPLSSLTPDEVLALLSEHAPHIAQELEQRGIELESVEDDVVEYVEESEHTPNPEFEQTSDTEASGVTNELGEERVWSASLARFVTVKKEAKR